MFLIIFPFSSVLSLWIFEGTMTLLGILNPVSLVVGIFEVVILSEALFKPVHPLALIDNVFSLIIAYRFTKKSPAPVLPTFFEFSPILKVLLCEVVHPTSFDILASPCSVVAIPIRELILKFSEFLVVLLFWWESLTCVHFRDLLLLALPLLLVNWSNRGNVHCICFLFWTGHGLPRLLLVRWHPYSLGGRLQHLILFCFFEFCQRCFLSCR